MKPRRDVGLVEPVGEDAVDDLVGDELAGVHHRLGLRARPVPAATAARSMSPVESWTMPRSCDEPARLGALAGARRAQQDDVHAARSPSAERRPSASPS